MAVVIAVIGCGSIGMRHVEALARMQRPVHVFAVDKSEEAAIRAKGLFDAVKSDTRTEGTVSTARSINELPNVIDLAIIATDAHGRLDVIRTVLSGREVKAMVLEKFLFPRATDYSRAHEVLGGLRERAWVNCTRRLYPAYQEAANRLRDASFLQLRVSGSAAKAPLGAIGIHFVDLLAFLGGNRHGRLNAAAADVSVLATRRGVDDFSGTVHVRSEDGRLHLEYSALVATEAPLNVSIETDKARWLIQEWCQCAYVATPETSWRFQAVPFAIPLQSQLTHLMAERIVSGEGCDLPSFEESAGIHLCLMGALLDAYRVLKKDPELESVPFT